MIVCAVYGFYRLIVWFLSLVLFCVGLLSWLVLPQWNIYVPPIPSWGPNLGCVQRIILSVRKYWGAVRGESIMRSSISKCWVWVGVLIGSESGMWVHGPKWIGSLCWLQRSSGGLFVDENIFNPRVTGMRGGVEGKVFILWVKKAPCINQLHGV